MSTGPNIPREHPPPSASPAMQRLAPRRRPDSPQDRPADVAYNRLRYDKRRVQAFYRWLIAVGGQDLDDLARAVCGRTDDWRPMLNHALDRYEQWGSPDA